jgi:xanthine dehydrogenase YagS FAD-binding subunit
MSLPRAIADLAGAAGEYRAGGTDLQERLRSGVTRGPIVDIHHFEGFGTVTWGADGAASIGSLVTVADVGRDARLAAAYPALVLPARTLATPQIREMATMGGVLLQRTRCWYYRHPSSTCSKRGGEGCPARAGNHRFGVIFDRGACVHPHPSSIGMALLGYDAAIEVEGRGRMPVAALYGDGVDPTRDHHLAPGELLTQIRLPRPVAGERGAYFRMMSREWAEWPLVEVSVRLVVDGGVVRLARVAAGGVAPVPIRLPAVESLLEGRAPSPDAYARAAAAATEGARPLPMTGYKLELLRASVLETLERA